MIQIYQKVPSKISTIMISFDAGARAEGDKYSPGLAHFLEHMIFKGTEKRNHLDIPREIGFLGGSINAYTSQEMVVFHISVPYENAEKAVEILADIVFNPLFPEEEFKKELEVVKEEERTAKDDVISIIQDEFAKRFFSDRLAEPIIGTQETISGFTLKELKDFHRKFYKKSEAVISFCSNHSVKAGKKILKKHFGKASGKVKHDVKTFSPTYQDSQTVIIERPQLEQSYLWVGYPGSPIGAPNEVAEDLLVSILGQGMDSRLFVEARENRGLCYDINASSVGYRDYACLVITSASRPENTSEILEVIESEIKKIKTERISDEELERAKNKYRAMNYAIWERSYSLAKVELSRVFFNLCTLEDLEKDLEKIQADDILDLARTMFDETKRLVLICQDGEEQEDEEDED